MAVHGAACRGVGMRFPAAVAVAAVVAAASAHARSAAYGSAAGLWADTLARAPANPRALENASVLALRTGSEAEMLALHAAFPQAAGADFRAQARAAAAFGRAGRAAEASAARQRAFTLIDEALARDAANADAWFHLGNLMRSTDKPEAERAYRRAVDCLPTHADARANLGALVALRDPTEARALYDQALAIDPANADAWNNLGVLLMRQGEPLEAARCFRAALAAVPTLPAARSNLARIEGAAQP